MRRYITLILCLFSCLTTLNCNAKITQSTRIPLFENKEVNVWRTVIYPNKDQILKMHRHEHNRVVVALDSGKLKVTDNKGQVHYLELEKDKAYYLTKDAPNELHTDENVGHHPIKVVVIELNK